jgi:hypothetical protein
MAFVYRCNKAVVMAIKGLDNLLSIASITERLAYGCKATGERRVADYLTRP